MEHVAMMIKEGNLQLLGA